MTAASEGGRLVVADAMLHAPTVSAPAATVGELRRLFTDDHVHAALLVDATRLVAVLDRGDLLGAAEGDAAAGLAPLAGRTVGPAEDLERVRLRMVAQGIRRLAVVDDGGALLGLLCLKRSGSGFCSDDDVAARAAERRGPGVC